MANDWFTEAMEQTASKRVVHNLPDRAVVARVAELFKDVKAGRIPVVGTGLDRFPSGDKYSGKSRGGLVAPGDNPSPARTITPKQALEVILKHVSEAGDSDEVLRSGGEWIAKTTNGISEIIRQADEK